MYLNDKTVHSSNCSSDLKTSKSLWFVLKGHRIYKPTHHTQSVLSGAAVCQPFLSSVNGELDTFEIETEKGKKKDYIIFYQLI